MAESEIQNDLARRIMEQAYQEQMAGHLDEAIRLYKMSIGLRPTAEAHTFLGWAYSLQHRYEEAIQQCLQAIAVDATFGNPYNDIGAYLIELGRHAEAITWLERAIVAPRYENRALPFMNLARIYRHRGDDWKALEAFRNAWQVDPSHMAALDAYHALLGRFN